MEITDETRRGGAFYTPPLLAEAFGLYIDRALGEGWEYDNSVRVWDMAAGTGNLETALPDAILPRTHLSTLLPEDAAACKRRYPEAHCFAFDFLNDGPEAMPAELVRDLADPSLRWLVLVNPPYATAQDMSREVGKESRDGVSMTAARRSMSEEGYGNASQELFVQFLWRIHRIFKGRRAHLALVSKLKYLNSDRERPVRDGFFRYAFKGGFVADSRAFAGVKGAFPVGFAVWDMSREEPLEGQEIVFDVLDGAAFPVGTKRFETRRRQTLNKWCPRPPRSGGNGFRYPKFSSAFVPREPANGRWGLAANGFVAGIASKGDDFQNRNAVAILSTPHHTQGEFSVTPANFDRAMALFAVKRIPRGTWLNDRDLFYAPEREPDRPFYDDCAVWTAFSRDNGCASFARLAYGGAVWDIPNGMFPFRAAEVLSWLAGNPHAPEVESAPDSFLSGRLAGPALSPEASAVMEAGREAFREFWTAAPPSALAEGRISRTDAGLVQVKRASADMPAVQEALARLKAAEATLAASLEPRIRELGFLA